MLKKYIKLGITALALFMVISTFGTGAGAGNVKHSQNLETQQLAELLGNIDFTSSMATTVIVELKEPSIVESKQIGKNQSKGNLAKVRNKVKSDLSKVVSNSKVKREYDYVFSGFSVELPASQIPALLAVEGIKAVYPNVTYSVTSEGTREIIPTDVHNPQMLNSAPYIGANAVWETGFTGEGVTVAVIDTGADYTHPDLMHAFGDYKGWDFVDNDSDPQETPLGDPRGQETSHGTHVSGTIAANGLIKGVAPSATLLAYRVLGPGGSGTTENVIAGIEMAVRDGADIMNLSLGAPINSPDEATSIALDWAMAEGVVAITSNGNTGPANWTVGSPGTSRQAISVGATRLPYNVYNGTIFTSDGVSYPSSKVMGFDSDEELLTLEGNTYEFVDVGFGGESDFEGKDLNGKIALISRGSYYFVTKAENAMNAGAVGAIIYNNREGEIPYEIPGMAVPTLKLTYKDGMKMLEELQNGNNEVTINIEFSKHVNETMADFSSRGPAFGTWMIKPDVSAPGVNITSTVPTHNPNSPHGYAAYQGTSMAAPHVAGAAALLLEAHPNWDVNDVKAALMNTAEKIIDPTTDQDYPHNTQGAGSIRVYEAIHVQTLVTPGSHSFGTFYKDKGKQVENQHFTIKNLSSEKQTYSFQVNFGEYSDSIKVMTSKNLQTQAGKTQQVTFNVQVDAGKLNPGYYEGTVTVSSANGTFDVPTILFVKEPDYPRVTSGYMTKVEEGKYLLGSYLPGGAEVVEYYLFEYDALQGVLGPYLGFLGGGANVPAGSHELYWDGKIDGNDLPSGNYVLAVYAEKAGKNDFIAYLVTKE